jgi:hypothetical protein
MKIMMSLHLIYYFVLLAFMLFIPQGEDANVSKIVMFLLILGAFIFLCTFYIVLSFNKKIKAIKKYYYLNIALMCSGIILYLTFGHMIYKQMNSLVVLIVVFILLFIASNLLNYKILQITKNLQFDFMKEVKLFYKMGQALEETPIINAISKLDNLFIAFAVLGAISQSIYFFTAIVAIILIVSHKYLRILKVEFLKSQLISEKESNLSMTSYYFFYLLSIFWAYYIPNLSVILVGGASIILLKLNVHKIAEKVYEEKNHIS